MKRIILPILAGLMLSASAFGQESKNDHDEMNQFLAKEIKYPTELRRNQIKGMVVYQFSFNEDGFPISREVVSGDPALAASVDETLVKLVENWDPEWLGKSPRTNNYLMSFNFQISKSKPVQGIHLGRYSATPTITTEKAIDTISKRIDSNPFDPQLYLSRAELYTEAGSALLAEKDLMLADFFKEKMLTEIVIVGYDTSPKSLRTTE